MGSSGEGIYVSGFLGKIQNLAVMLTIHVLSISNAISLCFTVCSSKMLYLQLF